MDGIPIRPEWVDEIVCEFSVDHSHPFSESDLEELVINLEAKLNEKLVGYRNLAEVVIELRSREMHEAAGIVQRMANEPAST